MTDTIKLKELISQKGLKMKFIAESLGLSAYGFQLKVENKQEFKTGEVAALCEILDVRSLREKEAIFFARIDDLKSTKKSKKIGDGRYGLYSNVSGRSKGGYIK